MKSEILMEGYPDKIQARLELKDKEERASTPGYINDISLGLVLEDIKLWTVGELKVSFKGGSNELHAAIAEVAQTWSKYGNITFDFGYNPSDGSFRHWTETDNSHIRIGFEYRGYWSLVGVDSRDPRIVNPGDITLNLGGFDDGLELTSDHKGTILHEFGHALGFHHGHQSPDLECDFDWPNLYRTLAGPPNYWPKAKVDHNLKQLSKNGLTFSAHDKHSIMHYSFPNWMFMSGVQSPCFTTRNNDLSETDKHMMEKAYPKDEGKSKVLANNRTRNLSGLLNLSEGMTEAGRAFHQEHLDYLRMNFEQSI